VEDVLVFEEGEDHKTVDIQIKVSKGHSLEGDEGFKVLLSDPSPGVKFDENRNGYPDNAICDVIIMSAGQGGIGRCCRNLFNSDKCAGHMRDWFQQFVDAFYCNGSPEDQAGAGATDWFLHGLNLFWKFGFAFVPPPKIAGGWVCFCAALGMIGIVTAFVGDMATLLGCCVGIPGDITAITLVALGTSLPDTFASKLAAQQDENADNSIGNVTGSNCVNVFLGLGLPWTIAALYWGGQGVTPEWLAKRYKDETFDVLFRPEYPEGGFIVPSGSLGFSVSVFIMCATSCIGLLIFRRFRYGGELGGPQSAQNRDSGILCFLWVVYIALSCAYSLTS
jgi:solute carrier family 8 (sodium/calcium exchanger)